MVIVAGWLDGRFETQSQKYVQNVFKPNIVKGLKFTYSRTKE